MTELIQTIAFGLLVGGVYALLASGLTLIFGVMNVINIAHGAFLILAAFLTFTLWSALGIDPLAAIVITTPAMLAFGWLVYVLTVRPIRRAPPSSSVLLTFGLALVLEAVMGLIWGNQSHAARPSYFTESFHISGIVLPKGQVYACALAAVVLACLWLFLARSWTGRAIRAAAVNPSGAELVGIDIVRVSALTFAIGVGTVGAGGALVSVLYPFLPGSHYIWIARLLGIIVLAGTFTQTYASAQWATAVPYAVILVVLLVRPHGIMGTRLREDVAA